MNAEFKEAIANVSGSLSSSRPIAGVFVNVTGYLSSSHIRAASCFECTDIAVEFGGAIAEHVAVVHGAGGV
jgi:hypothetical protein